MARTTFLLLICLIASCTKSSQDPILDNQTLSNTELLVNKKWKITAISGKLADGTLIPDDYSGLPSYKKIIKRFYFTKNDQVIIALTPLVISESFTGLLSSTDLLAAKAIRVASTPSSPPTGIGVPFIKALINNSISL